MHKAMVVRVLLPLVTDEPHLQSTPMTGYRGHPPVCPSKVILCVVIVPALHPPLIDGLPDFPCLQDGGYGRESSAGVEH